MIHIQHYEKYPGAGFRVKGFVLLTICIIVLTSGIIMLTNSMIDFDHFGIDGDCGAGLLLFF